MATDLATSYLVFASTWAMPQPTLALASPPQVVVRVLVVLTE
ncbi:hypothetical protein ACIQVC_20680 [Streptomyces sp. NPDC101112]